MKPNLSRRYFLATSSALAAGVGFGLGAAPCHGREMDPAFMAMLHEGLIAAK